MSNVPTIQDMTRYRVSAAELTASGYRGGTNQPAPFCLPGARSSRAQTDSRIVPDDALGLCEHGRTSAGTTRPCAP